MNEKKKNEQVHTWEEIEKRVVESFDLEDVGAHFGVSRWREHVEKARGAEDAGEIAHSFTSTEVIDAAVDFFKSDIAENMAIFKVKLARNDRLMKLMSLRVALGEAQGVFVDEENGEHVIPELLAVIRVTKSAKTKMLRQVVQASLTLASNNGAGEVDPPSWPAGLGDDIQDFANDLTEFINNNGDTGREMVTRVCQDAGFAKKVCTDEDMPKPIRFLAQIVVETKTDNHLPDKERRIGFGFGSR